MNAKFDKRLKNKRLRNKTIKKNKSLTFKNRKVKIKSKVDNKTHKKGGEQVITNDEIINRISKIKNTDIRMDNYEDIISELSYLYDETKKYHPRLMTQIVMLEQEIVKKINNIHATNH